MLAFLLLLTTASGLDLQRDWWQWGGPMRNFTVEAPRLATDWSASGPRELFRRPLRGGHSAVGHGADRLFVVHGGKGREWVLALDLRGKTLWETSYDVGYTASIAAHDGPHAAPLVLDDRVVTVAIDATVRAWSVSDGRLLWSRDLRADHGVELPQAGYAASPLPIGEELWLPGLGGRGSGYRRVPVEGLGVLRLDVETGSTLGGLDAFPASHASPTRVGLGERELAIFHGMELLVGVDVATAETVWKIPVRNGAADNVSFMPVWDASRRQLIVSHAYDRRGAQAFRLGRDASSEPVRVWNNPRLKVEHGNGLLWNDLLVASDGSEPGFLTALDAATGELAWKERIPKATLLGVRDQGVLLLDAEGTLHFAQPDRQGSNVRSSLEVVDGPAWTAPTLIGRVLVVRDPTTLVVLRLP